MTLVRPDPRAHPAQLSMIVADSPLRIGRGAGNDWEFPQDRISRRQAVVRPRGGLFFVENHSRVCAMAVRTPERTIKPGDCETLVPGESFWMDDVEVASEIVEDASLIPVIPDEPEHRSDPRASGTELDPIKILIGNLDKNTGTLHSSEESLLDPGQHRLDEKWWEQPSTSPQLDPASPTKSSWEGQPDARELLLALCDGAGIEPRNLDLSLEGERELGATLRASLTGVSRLLQGRQTVRHEMRLERTRIFALANNPLKAEGGDAQMMKQILQGPAQGFLPPTTALEEAFEDLMDHQIAQIDALRAAFEQLLKELSPDFVVDALERSNRGVFSRLLPRSASAWAYYEARHRRWAEDPEDAYRRLFGDALAEAYAQQVDRLRSMRKAVRRKRIAQREEKFGA